MNNKLVEKMKILLIIVVIINLIGYQLILPVRFALAEEESVSSSDSASSDSEPASSEESSDETGSSDNPSDASENSQSSQQADPETSQDSPTENDSQEASASEQTSLPASSEAQEAPAQNNLPISDTSVSDPSDGQECECGDQSASQDCSQFPDGICPEHDSCECGSDDESIDENTVTGDVTETTTANADVPAIGSGTENSSAGCKDNDGQSSDGDSESDGDQNDDEDSSVPVVPSGGGSSAILTGNASALTVAVNEINTNIYTENGQQIIENITGDFVGDINLSDAFQGVLENGKNLLQENQEAFEHVVISNTNVAEDVSNSAVATAASGDNSIENGSGKSDIVTGSAEAVAGAINLINTNIVGNNWLVAIINVVGNWTGDLIVPGEGLLETPSGKMIFDEVVNLNIAEDIKNFILASANSGANSISGIGTNYSITTGDAESSVGGINLVNTNITSNNWFFLMINNSGTWLGRVINWSNDTGEQQTVYEYDFGSLEDPSDIEKIVSVYNSNTAKNVTNTVLAEANTGNNEIVADGKAIIQTGDASAWASAINFVNTNIVGNNWLFAVVNNMGNWKGDVVFAYPDLAVSIKANKSKVKPGEKITYTVTYKNVGQAKCADAEIMMAFPNFLKFNSDSAGFRGDGGSNIFRSVSGLKPGEEKSFKVNFLLDKNVSLSVANIGSQVGIRTQTAEKELANNFADLKTGINFSNSQFFISESSAKSLKESGLDVERSDDHSVVMGNVANHSLMVKNSGKHTLYNVLVSERIKDPSGSQAVEYFWPIAELRKGQTAYIQYQIVLDQAAMVGQYEHKAQALGYDEYANEIESDSAVGMINLMRGTFISSPAEPEVPAPVAPEESAVISLPKIVLGAETSSGNETPWGWLAALALLPVAHLVRKKELYRWENIQRAAKYASGFLSSFF